MNLICRRFVFVPVVPPCFTFAFPSPLSWHLSHFVVPFFFLFLFFFSSPLVAAFIFFIIIIICAFLVAFVVIVLLVAVIVAVLVVSYFVISFSGISFDLIIILSWHDKKPPTRHSCPASPHFYFYSQSPCPPPPTTCFVTTIEIESTLNKCFPGPSVFLLVACLLCVCERDSEGIFVCVFGLNCIERAF